MNTLFLLNNSKLYSMLISSSLITDFFTYTVYLLYPYLHHCVVL